MGVIENVVAWLEARAADPKCGYDQINRWGPDYDCSSMVITAWETFGVPLKTKGATYTGNMRSVALRCGFEDVTSKVNIKTGAGLQRGDILLNTKHHVATYCGNGKEVEASINEKGTAKYGKTGDQLGNTYGKGEVLVRSYRNYPWNYVLRYTRDTTSSTTTPTTNTTSTATPTVLWYGKVTASELNVRRYPHSSAQVDYVVKRNDPVAVEEYSHWYKIGTNRWVCADYVTKTSGSGVAQKKGIDVSSYQGTINWNQVKASGVEFAILRGVVKDGTMDSNFETYYKGATNAGIEIKGVYHFLYATNTTEAAAAAHNMIYRLNGKKLFIWLDLEWSDLQKTGKVTEIANAYIDTIKSLGYEVGVYSNTNWYKNVYKPSQLHVTKFWIASYASSGAYKESLKPNVGEYIWQWGSKGFVSGISGNVDMNICYEPATGDTYTVSASTLNIRSLPCTIDPSSKVLGTLKKGATINVLEDSLWYKVQNTKAVGWSSSKYVTK